MVRSINNIGIKSMSHSALISEIIVSDDLVYIVSTEEKGNNSTEACSRVYLYGRILFSRDADFSHLVGVDNFSQKLSKFLKQHHESVVAYFYYMLVGKSECLSNATCLVS